jgi:hypothetical protein
MLNLPSALRTAFETCLQNTAIPKAAHAAYTKWLRYYLDSCQKYHFPHAQKESLPRFLHKLQEKKQTQAQQQQASLAVSLYYELMRFRDSHSDVPSLTKDDPPEQALDGSSHRPDSLPSETSASPKASSAGKAPDQLSPKTVSSSNAAKTSPGVSWLAVYTRLANEIQVRHYSLKTLKAYTQWVRHFQTFTRSKDPASLSSTQNQAFNALFFLQACAEQAMWDGGRGGQGRATSRRSGGVIS